MMNEELIRVDTDETRSLVSQLERLSDEMDSIVTRLRAVAEYLQEPRELTEALRAKRRQVNLLIEKVEQMARRLRQVAEDFDACEAWLGKQAYIINDVYLMRKAKSEEAK
ncbi:MAG: hypothetical protein IKL25_09955 [Clostridia bacterium]|nr:hypothetical protein [Clostridia bacterium]